MEEMASRKPGADPEPSDGDGDDEPDELAEVVVTVEAHEVDEVPAALNAWRKRAIDGGWDFKLGHCQAEVPPTYYVDREKGIRYDGYTVDQYWMNAIRGDEYVTIAYWYKDGKSQSNRTTRTSRLEWYRKFSDAQMKEHMK